MIEKKKILVADDDVQLVDSVKTLLEGAGYRVFFTYKSEKIVETVKDVQPDLVLLDVMFAGESGPDGFEVSRALSMEPTLRDIPVLILSGVRKVMDLPFSYKPDDRWMPVKAFIEKPVKPDVLLGEIKKILGPLTSGLR
jgi:CheY-like chemotaxis protein